MKDPQSWVSIVIVCAFMFAFYMVIRSLAKAISNWINAAQRRNNLLELQVGLLKELCLKNGVSQSTIDGLYNDNELLEEK